MVELSGTGVPPSSLDEVLKQRSGLFRLKLSTAVRFARVARDKLLELLEILE